MAAALAALGRIDDFDQVMDEIQIAPDLPDRLSVLVSPVDFLRVNGHTGAARQAAERAVHFFETSQRADATARYEYGRALFLAGRLEEAKSVFDTLLDWDPANVEFRGERGVVAASLGEMAQAIEDARWLEGLDGTYLRAEHTFYRGVIAGALGEHDLAVELIGQALATGQQYWPWLLIRAELDPVRAHPGFQELIRPKG